MDIALIMEALAALLEEVNEHGRRKLIARLQQRVEDIGEANEQSRTHRFS